MRIRTNRFQIVLVGQICIRGSGEAVAEQERESKGKLGHGGRGTPLVVAGLNESRGVYVVVGTGGGGGGGMGFGDRQAAKEKKENSYENSNPTNNRNYSS